MKNNYVIPINDLIMLNYYEGVYDGMIQDESRIEEAQIWYYNWLINMCKRHNVQPTYRVKKVEFVYEYEDAIKEMHENLQTIIESKMLIIDIEDLVEEIVDDLKDNHVENGRVNDFDIMICCENYLNMYKSDCVNKVYSKLEQEGIEYY